MRKLSPIAVLFIGFAGLILLGSLLLTLPIAHKEGVNVSYIDALFISTSGTCVTGLTPLNVFKTFNLFGQIVLLVLIQIGGLGFMTFIAVILLIINKQLGIYNQTIIMQSAGTFTLGSVKPLLKRILLVTFIFEGTGWVLLSLFLRADYGNEAWYIGLFTSISAFCNAGFDLFESSLTTYKSNPGIILTICALINLGGIGFVVYSDLIDVKFNFKKLQMHSKLVLLCNAIVIVIPFFLFFLFEFVEAGQMGKFVNLPFGEKVLNSLFLSITPRTAGFYTLPYDQLTAASKGLTMILMFIGGNSGSTAGGVKVTTIAVIILSLVATAKGSEETVAFKQRITKSVIQQSSALFFTYAALVIIAGGLVTSYEEISLESGLFECISALATVGLTLGITSVITVPTKIVLIILMYLGRVGAFGLFSLILKKSKSHGITHPEGRIMVG